jgi:hypothetical protein
MDKISTIKKNILLFVENQGFKKEEFFNNIGVSYSNFKGKSLNSEISADKLVTILTKFPNINSDWLLTGKGEMLKQKLTVVQEPGEDYIINSELKEKIIQLQDEKILLLEEKLEQCLEEKKILSNTKINT